MRQLLLELLPDMPPSLDNFVAGSNGETMAGFAAWLAPGNGESSLFLWGETGAGKTHLLRASGACYLDAATSPALDEASADARFIAIDHVDALSAAGQIALFNLFNRLRTAGGRLLTASRLPPAQLVLREDLRTRLGSGLIYRLNPLTDAEKSAALATQAETRRMRLPAEAIDYLMARAPRDMRSLSGYLAALDRYSLEHKRAITLPLLREVLQTPLN